MEIHHNLDCPSKEDNGELTMIGTRHPSIKTAPTIKNAESDEWRIGDFLMDFSTLELLCQICHTTIRACASGSI